MSEAVQPEAVQPAVLREVRVFGVRHHGPGCARALLAELNAFDPDCVLVEGPPDADDVLPLLAHEEMKPPVALMVHAPEEPGKASYYPFAAFSPEYIALKWALERSREVRFMDLPQYFRMRREQFQGEGPRLPIDPIAELAEAAGVSPPEAWWEQQVELRQDTTDMFQAVAEGMAVVRFEHGDENFVPANLMERRREAWMRRTLQKFSRRHDRIAVVCGAWHVPAVRAGIGKRPDISKKHDDGVLKGLLRRKTVATWIPWTTSRLSRASGYGAGIRYPGWFRMVWELEPTQLAERWTIHVARVLRDEGFDISSAHVIEAVRLAEALAALRGLSRPGMAELEQAVLSVLCAGDPARLDIARGRLEVGDQMGHVPPQAQSVPLQQDVDRLQRSLRIRPQLERIEKQLDLRKDGDRARSHLLARLAVLDVRWGTRFELTGQGTWKEGWVLKWDPAFALNIVEASVYGSTVEQAATSRLVELAEEAELDALCGLLDTAILAALPQAIERTLVALDHTAAVSADIARLMDTLPPLSTICRYGDVRGTPEQLVLPVVDGFLERILVGLPGACASLDDEGADKMVDRIGATSSALGLLHREDLREDWLELLDNMSEDAGVHGTVRGRCARLLLEAGEVDGDELDRRAFHALSTAAEPRDAALWLDGLLRGSGLVLLHQEGLWNTLDRWIGSLDEEDFIALLPIARRAFSGFGEDERRRMGAKLRSLGMNVGGAPTLLDVDTKRAARVLPILKVVLGV